MGKAEENGGEKEERRKKIEERNERQRRAIRDTEGRLKERERMTTLAPNRTMELFPAAARPESRCGLVVPRHPQSLD
jgi:hypothetical protein